jgi:hypothetical protein
MVELAARVSEKELHHVLRRAKYFMC